MELKSYTYDELLALATIKAADPSEQTIGLCQRSDMNRNPHNESHKPKIRTREEIIAEYKLEQGLAVMKAVDKHMGPNRHNR